MAFFSSRDDKGWGGGGGGAWTVIPLSLFGRIYLESMESNFHTFQVGRFGSYLTFRASL